jgi:hypothetical protein
MRERKLKLSINRNLALALMVFLILPALIAGYTYAVVVQGWFTDDNNIVSPGVFEMGTVIIDANRLGSDPVGPLGLDDCTTINYNITNEGSKRVYVRARFDGIWQRSFHKNTATVTAYHNGQPYTATDSAYFNYVNEVPAQFPGVLPPVVDFGFNHNIYLPPLVFPALQFTSSGPLASGPEVLSISGSEFELQTQAYNHSSEGDGQLLISEEDEPGSMSMMLVAEQYEATGWGVIPVKRDFIQPWGIPLNFQSPCGELRAYKFNINDDGQIETTEGSDSGINFSVDFEEIESKIYFSNASHPIVYVWVKGGAQGMLFSYYDLNGVRNDTGLYPPPNPDNDGFFGLSHITFFYCVPTEEDNPSVTIDKEVSVDGGANWYPADTPETAPTLQEGFEPEFRFIVTNTGNVPLINVTVVDDRFGQIGSIAELAQKEPDGTGGTVTFDYTYDDWLTEAPLSTANVQLSLGSSNDEHWTPLDPQALGDYFYYESVLFPPTPSGMGAVRIPLSLSLNVCLNSELTGPEYEGAVLILYASFEAIQVTNNMDELNWGVTIESE